MITSFVYCPEIFSGNIHGALVYGSRIRQIPNEPLFNVAQSVTPGNDNGPISFYGITSGDRSRIKDHVITHLRRIRYRNFALVESTMSFPNIWLLWAYFACKDVGMRYGGTNNIPENDLISILLNNVRNRSYERALAICVFGFQFLFGLTYEDILGEYPTITALTKSFMRSFYSLLVTPITYTADDLDMRQIDIYRQVYQTPDVTLYRPDRDPVGNGPYHITQQADNTYTINGDSLNVPLPGVVPPIPIFGQQKGANITGCKRLSAADEATILAADVVRDLPPASKRMDFDRYFHIERGVSQAEIILSRYFKKHPVPIMCGLIGELYDRIGPMLRNDHASAEEIRDMRRLIDVLWALFVSDLITEKQVVDARELLLMIQNLESLLDRYDT